MWLQQVFPDITGIKSSSAPGLSNNRAIMFLQTRVNLSVFLSYHTMFTNWFELVLAYTECNIYKKITDSHPILIIMFFFSYPDLNQPPRLLVQQIYASGGLSETVKEWLTCYGVHGLSAVVGALWGALTGGEPPCGAAGEMHVWPAGSRAPQPAPRVKHPPHMPHPTGLIVTFAVKEYIRSKMVK